MNQPNTRPRHCVRGFQKRAARHTLRLGAPDHDLFDDLMMAVQYAHLDGDNERVQRLLEMARAASHARHAQIVSTRAAWHRTRERCRTAIARRPMQRQSRRGQHVARIASKSASSTADPDPEPSRPRAPRSSAGGVA